MEVPVVFPSFVPHDTFKDLKPVAAGFCKPCEVDGKDTWQTFGKSVGLNLKSRINDGLLILKTFRFLDTSNE